PRAELETWHPFRETRKVLDALRVQDRAARAERIEQDRAPPVTRGEEGCGESRRPSARYCDLVVRHALLQRCHGRCAADLPPKIRGFPPCGPCRHSTSGDCCIADRGRAAIV